MADKGLKFVSIRAQLTRTLTFRYRSDVRTERP